MQLKAKVDEEATKAKQSIDNATTNEADQAKTQGVTTITAIQPDTIKRQKRNAQTKSLKLRNKKLIITQMQQKKKKM